jgi:septin family protein
MKHVKLFESFEIEMTPEEFGQKIDDILQSGGDHLAITRALKRLISSTERYRYNKAYTAQLKELSPWIDSLSDEEKEEVKALNKELNTTPQEMEDEHRKAKRERVKAKESNPDKGDTDSKAAIAKLLDDYKNGTVDIEQATEEILRIGNSM